MENATYKITIPGQDPHTFCGTQEELWTHVSERMADANVPAGAVPKIEPDQPETLPAPGYEAPAIVETTSEPDPVTEANADLSQARAMGLDRDRKVFSSVRGPRSKWERLPRVPEVVERFEAEIAAENRRDHVVPIAGLSMRQDGTIGAHCGQTWIPEKDALPQLGARLGIKSPAFLADLWPELRARVWNQHIATIVGHPGSTCPADHPARERLVAKSGQSIFCRVRNGADGGTALWAALSERYGAFDVNRCAQGLEIAMRAYPEARCSIAYNGTGAVMDVLFHSNVEPTRLAVGETFKAGLRVKTSDSGGGSIAVSLLVYQSLCANLMEIGVGAFTFDRIRHLGDPERLAERFRAAVTRGTEALGPFLRAWGYATDETLATVVDGGVRPEHLRLLDAMEVETLSQSELAAGIFRGLAKADKVQLTRNDIPGLLAAHAKDESGAVQAAPITRASIVNAITRYAHEDVGTRDPMRRALLEGQAGALLVSNRGNGRPAPLPFLPPKQA